MLLNDDNYYMICLKVLLILASQSTQVRHQFPQSPDEGGLPCLQAMCADVCHGHGCFREDLPAASAKPHRGKISAVELGPSLGRHTHPQSCVTLPRLNSKRSSRRSSSSPSVLVTQITGSSLSSRLILPPNSVTNQVPGELDEAPLKLKGPPTASGHF